MSDRRKDRRAPVNLILNAYQDGLPGLALADNISTTGIRFRRLLEPRARPGRQIDLEFQLPNDSEVIYVRGERVYQSAVDGSVGVRFVELTTKQSRKMQAFVAQCRAA